MMCMEKSCTFAAPFHNGEMCVTVCQMIGRRFFSFRANTMFGQFSGNQKASTLIFNELRIIFVAHSGFEPLLPA